MSILPVDVIIDILVKLPAKSLLRFKSVCKLWYDIISNPNFIRSHFQQSNNLHIVYCYNVFKLSDFDTFDNTIELDYPFKNLNVGHIHVEGSCRGLLCLRTSSPTNELDYPVTVFLYNPTTQKHKILPYLPQKSVFRRKGSEYLGFGYDHVSDDYKCVRILLHRSEEVGSFKSQVMVYSLKADSWRRGAQDVPYYFYCFFGYYVYFDGILHWSVEDDNEVPLPIVSFNLNDESFGSVPLPSTNVEPYGYMCAHIGVLDDCLCVMLNYYECCDVWIMKEYNIPATWTKMFRFPEQQMTGMDFRPLSFSISKKQLFLTFYTNVLASLDMETLETTEIQLPSSPRVLCPYICPENLLMFKDAEDVLVGRQLRKKNSKRRRLMRRTERALQHYDSILKSFREQRADQMQDLES